MLSIGHTELLVVLLVSSAVHVAALAILGWQLYDSRKMVAESQRLTRAVGALVIQEEEKTRQLFPR